MSELRAPWRWKNRRHEDWMKKYERKLEEHARLRATGNLGPREWLDLCDADGNVIVEYADCGSHEITIEPENAAILEAAAELYAYVRHDAHGGDADAIKIMDGIEARQAEFEE